MPDTRLGFGKERITDLMGYCTSFIEKFGYCDPQVSHAIATIKEYKAFHLNANHPIDPELAYKIDTFESRHSDILASHQQVITGTEYFANSHSEFFNFSNSRRSIRNYSPVAVELDTIEKAISLARNAPSVCNRQSVRVHVYSDRETVQSMLKVQAGNRGFGHLANKVIAVTAELGAMHGLYERNQSFVDGGMWAMNLLYALHYYKIAACPLNCSNSPEKDRLLRKYGKIDNSETFIMLISIGHAADSFKMAASPRKSVGEIATFHNSNNHIG